MDGIVLLRFHTYEIEFPTKNKENTLVYLTHFVFRLFDFNFELLCFIHLEPQGRENKICERKTNRHLLVTQL